MDIREKQIKTALAVALRRVEAGDLTADDYRDIAALLDGVLPTDAAPTTETATPLSVPDAVSEIVRKRGQS